jgi:serine/threonine-protein kinase HSL1 (negative regulator of Swe1 kinase)
MSHHTSGNSNTPIFSRPFSFIPPSLRTSQGQVKIAKSMRTGEYAAVKIVPRHVMVASAHRYDQPDAKQRHKMREREERQQLTLEREIVIMKLIDHPNVISLLDVHEKDGLM